MPSQWRLTVRGLDDGGKPTVGGPEIPVFEVRLGVLSGWLIVEVLEGEADLVGSRGLQVGLGEIVEEYRPASGEVCRVLEPDVAGVLQLRAVLLLGAADLVDGVVDDLHRMELVEGDLGLGKVLGDALDEGLAHVDADLRDGPRIAAMGGEIGGERRDRGAVLAVGREQDPALVEIGEQRDIVMAPAGRGFVEGDALDLGVIGGVSRLLDIVVNDPPQARVVLSNHPGHRPHRHGAGHGDDEGLEQQRETTAVPRPRHRGPLDATPWALDPRHAGMQVSFMLKEVEMPPCHLAVS